MLILALALSSLVAAAVGYAWGRTHGAERGRRETMARFARRLEWTGVGRYARLQFPGGWEVSGKVWNSARPHNSRLAPGGK